jgi:sugar lactone lactonase YvrE
MRKNVFRLFVFVLFALTLILLASQPVLAEVAEFNPTDHLAADLVLGQPNFTSNTAATSQIRMYAPSAIAVDPTTGKVFVADENNHRVLCFASLDGLTNGSGAEAVLGQANFNQGNPNRGGSVAANTMNSPSGVSVDSTGRLWVADFENNRVLRFDAAAAKANGADADGVLGQPDLTSNAPSTTRNGMDWPLSVFIDAEGRLWVADFSNHRVLRFKNASAKTNGDNADGVLGQPNFTSHDVATTQSGMHNPSGLFLDSSGRLWVADFMNNRVLRYDAAANKANGANANGVLGQVDYTSSGSACVQNKMFFPRGLSGDDVGRLYVADSLNNRILVFQNAAGQGNGANAHHVLGQPDFTTCTANTWGPSSASLSIPSGLFFEVHSKVLWAADGSNHRVLMYGNTSQKATLVLGQPDFTSNSATTTQTGLYVPSCVGIDHTTGKVFVADTYNHRVLRFASVTALSNGAAAEAVLGQADFSHSSPNRGGSVAANTMFKPLGLSVDSAGRLWVVDLENNRVLRFDAAAAKANGDDADGVLGQADFTHGDSNRGGPVSANTMNGPFGVSADSARRLWVADFINNRVLRFNNASAKANGADADGVLGQNNFTSKVNALTQSGMANPIDLFLDSSGRLWVVDNNRVLRFDDAASKPNGAAADGVLGSPNFTSISFGCDQNKMAYPTGVGVDLSGRLYVVDSSNHRILVFENAAGLPNGANASGLLGQSNFLTCHPNAGGISAASLYNPESVFFDTASNVLWVADSYNNRVLRYGTPQFRIFLPAVKNANP